MELVDTHCHIHFPDYGCDPDEVREAAVKQGVTRMICVGCTLEDSQAAVSYAAQHAGVWASIGFHPHEADKYVRDQEALQQLRTLAERPKVVAVGEIGLDYYYEHSKRDSQQKLLRLQLDLAQERSLPVIFHIREAFEDMWPILDDYPGVRGVVHSFTATEKELDQALERGLYIGLNGIMTFTKDEQQLAAAKKVPLDKLLLETDAPFLTPVPFRGKVCEPGHVVLTAKFLSDLRGESLEDLAAATTQNARNLFDL